MMILVFWVKEKILKFLRISWKRDSREAYFMRLPQSVLFFKFFIFFWISFARSNLNLISMDKLFCLPLYNSCQDVCFIFLLLCTFLFLFRIDEHFKTSPRIPGIDLNSTRVLFEKLMNSQHSMILEQVCFSHWQSTCLKRHLFIAIIQLSREKRWKGKSCINLNFVKYSFWEFDLPLAFFLA